MVVVWGFLRDAVVPCRVPALAERCDRMRPRLLRMAASVLRDEHEAEDAVQDAFAMAWRKRDGLRDVTRFEPWFQKVLVNTCRERLRQRRRSWVRTIEVLPEQSAVDETHQVVFATSSATHWRAWTRTTASSSSCATGPTSPLTRSPSAWALPPGP